METSEWVAALVRLNGGELVGKTRLQKVVYLLEALNLGNDFDYDYHNFGPFSSELAVAAEDAEELGYLNTREKLGTQSVPYVVFRASEESPQMEGDATKLRRMKSALDITEQYDAVVLELGATAHYFKDNGFGKKCWDEVVRRKRSKATPENLRHAQDMLKRLGL